MLRFVRSWSAISRSLPQFAPARRPHARRRLMRPTLLALEERALLSTIVVNNPTDTPVAGQIDLRQAIVQANTKGGNETITFDKTVFMTPQTITLNGTQLELSDTTGTETITGPKAGVTVGARRREPGVPGRRECDGVDLGNDNHRGQYHRRRWRH